MAGKKRKNPGWVASPGYKEQKRNEACTQYARWIGDDRALKKLRTAAIAECTLMVVFIILQGLMRIKDMQSAGIVIIPYGIEVVLVAVFVMRSVTLCEQARRMKMSVYKRTVLVLPTLAVFIALAAFAGLGGSAVYVIRNGLQDCSAARICYMVFKLMNIGLGLFAHFFMKQFAWKTD